MPIPLHLNQLLTFPTQHDVLSCWIVTLCCLSSKGPCRRKLDGIIQGMKDTSRIVTLTLYLPNCDRKGFFKRKQVSFALEQPSKVTLLIFPTIA